MKVDFSIMKIHCTQEMIGHDIIIPASEEGQEALKSLPPAEKMFCQIKHNFRHNIERHDLFHACIKLVSDNTGNSITVIKEQCKLDCRWFAGYAYYKDKHGKERLNVITRSIAFSEMNLQEADEFYGKAFDVLAGYLKISTEKLVDEAKLLMKHKHFCVVCGKPASHRHHCFSQSKPNKEKYGKKLIDVDFNRRWVCIDCHSSHAHIPQDLLWDEKKFIHEARRNGYLQKEEKENKDPAEMRKEILHKYFITKEMDQETACIEYYKYDGDSIDIDPAWVPPEY